MKSYTTRVAAALSLAAALFASASAADMLVPNYSFEDSLTGTWTQTFGVGKNGSVGAVTEQASDGTQSLKIVDAETAFAFGMESTKMTAVAGVTYTVYAQANVLSGSADLYIRFYNHSGSTDTYLSGGFATASSSTSGWQNLRVKMTAPATANRVSVLLYSNVGNTGTAYWDRIFITPEFTNLGVQVYDGAPNGTTFGHGADAHKAFAVITGAGPYRPLLEVIDTNTESVIDTISFPADTIDPTGVWGATTSDDSTGYIYFGSYSNAALYRHTPGTSTISKVASAPAGNEYVYDLASSGATDGKIYGGTFPGGRVFKYTPTAGMVQLAPAGRQTTDTFVAGLEYVRRLDYDQTQEALYMSMGGTGTNPGLWRWDVVKGTLNNLLPSVAMANWVNCTGGRVFVNVGSTTTVLNVTESNGTFLSSSTDATFTSTSPVSPENGGKVYYVGGGTLHVYDIASKVSTDLGKSLTTSARIKRFSWVNGVLVGISALSNRTYVMKYNPASGAFSHNLVANHGIVPGVLNEVQAGPDGRVYSSAYLTGGLGAYTPILGDADDASEELMYTGLGQIDRMAAHAGKLYVGVYPGALLYEYDPALAWGGGNPRFLINGSLASQDRIKAIAFDDAGTKVFAGSVAKTNLHDGSVSWYDFATQTSGQVTVTGQSAISLACWGTKLFVGTSTRPGYNASPTTTAGQIRIYDIGASGLTLAGTMGMPAPGGMKSVTKMITIGTGTSARIWGFADGYLFVLNPSTQQYEYASLEFSDVNYGTLGTYRDADLVQSVKDPGYLYGTIHSTYLFKINLSTHAVTQITAGADMATADALGDIYYNRMSDETTLGRYTP